MNYYCITYRLRDDPKGSKRYYEYPAESYDDAIRFLTEDVIKEHYNGQPDIFGIGLIILKVDEYLSIIKM